MNTNPPPDTLQGLTLALDMVGRAYEALAMLYELRHPGEYSAQNQMLKEYIADGFRHVEKALASDTLSSEAFRDAVLFVRGVFERVDVELAALGSLNGLSRADDIA